MLSAFAMPAELALDDSVGEGVGGASLAAAESEVRLLLAATACICRARGLCDLAPVSADSWSVHTLLCWYCTPRLHLCYPRLELLQAVHSQGLSLHRHPCSEQLAAQDAPGYQGSRMYRCTAERVCISCEGLSCMATARCFVLLPRAVSPVCCRKQLSRTDCWTPLINCKFIGYRQVL